jgi:hypothetical protein
LIAGITIAPQVGMSTSRIICIPALLIALLTIIDLPAQTIRAGGSLHYSIENANRIPEEIASGKPWTDRLYLDGTVDIELIHHVLYAYTSFYTAGPGLEAGVFFYPVRKLPVYVNLGVGDADKEGVPPFTVGLGGFIELGGQSSLRWRFNGIGLTPSLSLGYAYSLYEDYDMPARTHDDFEMSGFDIPNVTARVQATYLRKGRDCDVKFVLNNTTQQRQRDVLIDVMFYGLPIVPIEVRPIIASHAVPAGRVITSDDVPIFGLVGSAREIDAVSHGAFDKADNQLLEKLGLKPLRKNDIEITLTKFQVASDNVAEMKFDVRSNLAVDIDGIILRAELFDGSKNLLDVRYFSINERVASRGSIVPEMSTIHDVDPRTKYIKCTPLHYHQVDE